jgi:hypothetical protein
MPTRLLTYLRQNLLALTALFVALGGTSYAALRLPAGSVGSRQLQNHSITPAKFNRSYINGTVRAWAEVDANGTVAASSSKASVKVGTGPQGPGFYLVSWKNVAKPRGCFSLAGVSSLGSAGSIVTSLDVRFTPWNVFVHTYGAQGQFAAQAFYVAVIC